MTDDKAVTAADPRMVSLLSETRRNPVGWIYNALGERVWSKQQEILQALATNKLVTVRSSNAVGKSRLAALALIWWMNAYPYSYCITTGASWNSIKRIVWPDVRAMVNRAPLAELRTMGKINKTEWVIDDRWAAFGLAMHTPDAFGGYRTGQGVFVIVDEASALTPDIYEAIMGICAGDNCRVLLIGNPLRPEGPFYDSFFKGKWLRFHISAHDSPNVTGRAHIPGLATKAWIAEREADWGKSGPAYIARVEGNFPDSASNTVIPLSLAMGAAVRPKIRILGQRVRIGVDVARYGDDDTVYAVARGPNIESLERQNGFDLMQTANRVVALINQYDPELVNIDVIGYGAGVVDRLRELGYGEIVRGVNVSHAALDKILYANLRAELWYNFRDWLDAGGTLPNDNRLLGDLTGPTFRYTSKGQRILEPKEDTKKRLGRSPDAGDAVVLTQAPNVTRTTGVEMW